MTRDEATQKFYMALARTQPSAQVSSFNWCGGVADALIDLGLLKVDIGSTNPLEALALSMGLAGSSGPMTAAKVHNHLEILGFKVAKK